jgi:hypothetical protein
MDERRISLALIELRRCRHHLANARHYDLLVLPLARVAVAGDVPPAIQAWRGRSCRCCSIRVALHPEYKPRRRLASAKDTLCAHQADHAARFSFVRTIGAQIHTPLSRCLAELSPTLP